jgi:hypothetical protein
MEIQTEVHNMIMTLEKNLSAILGGQKYSGKYIYTLRGFDIDWKEPFQHEA